MMKEFCFGLALGTMMGVLIITSSDKMQKIAKLATKEAEKKINEIKSKIEKSTDED